MSRIQQSPRLAYMYARDHINGRWPEVESVIAQDPWFGLMYVKSILKQRWPEFEKNLLHQASTSFPSTRLTEAIKAYTKEFFPSGWPEMVTAWEIRV